VLLTVAVRMDEFYRGKKKPRLGDKVGFFVWFKYGEAFLGLPFFMVRLILHIFSM